MWDTNVGETIRHQRYIGAENVKLLFNIVPEAAAYLGERDIVSIAKSTVFNNRPDALCVSGLTAGTETDAAVLKRVKDTVPVSYTHLIKIFVSKLVTAVGQDLEINLSEDTILLEGLYQHVKGTIYRSKGVFEIDRQTYIQATEAYQDLIESLNAHVGKLSQPLKRCV